MKNTNIFLSSKTSTTSGVSEPIDKKDKKVKDIMKSLPYKLTNVHRRESLATCAICFRQQTLEKFTNCEHQSLCKKCTESHILSSIERGQTPACIIQYCRQPLSKASRAFLNLNEDTLKKWKALEFRSKIKLQHSQSLWHCQKPDCGGFIDPNNEACIICSEKHCNRCHRLNHQGECVAASFTMQGLKTCKFCQMRIYKEGGCPKIACAGCKRTICFQCLQQWSISHHGCAEYGWFSFLYNYFTQCCIPNTVNAHSEVRM